MARRTVSNSAALGESGEKEVHTRLERALGGHGTRMMGRADDGIDLLMQFRSPGPTGVPLHFGVQVKTGYSHVKRNGSRLRSVGLDPRRLREWRRASDAREGVQPNPVLNVAGSRESKAPGIQERVKRVTLLVLNWSGHESSAG